MTTNQLGRRWTAAEDNHLKWFWGEKSIEQLATDIGRTPSGATRRAVKLKLGRPSQGIWPVKKLARELKVSPTRLLNALKRSGHQTKLMLPMSTARGRSLYGISDDHVDDVKVVLDTVTIVFSDQKKKKRTTKGRWGVGKKPAACLKCKRTDRRHDSLGLCSACYVGRARRTQVLPKNPKGHRVLNEISVFEMRELRAAGSTMDKLATRFGVTRQTIARAVKGYIYKTAGGPIEA